MIDCSKDCPKGLPRKTGKPGLKITGTSGECFSCYQGQLREAETRANYLECVIDGIAVLLDAGDIETARECCE